MTTYSQQLPDNLNYRVSQLPQIIKKKNNVGLVILGLILCIILFLIVYKSSLNGNFKRHPLIGHIKRFFGFKEIIINADIDQPPVILKKREVFNIDNNDFTYKEAQLLCEALDCKLATYGQMIDAYNDGANWCNYGWSADGLALFPIQQSFYNQLQKYKKLKKSCGKPGINGGFFKNKELKFGVNCYGPKPDPIDSRIVYSSSSSCSVDKSIIAAYQKRLTEGNINVRPFNRNRWSDFSEQESAYIIPPEKKSDNLLERDIELAISLN